MIEIERIRAFLNSDGIEGPQQLRGYIPCNVRGGGTANYRGGPNPDKYEPMGVSGVTIATGVDLGQTDIRTMRDWGVEPGLVQTLIPYIGRTKRDAVMALNREPLTISQDEADHLDRQFHSAYAALVATRYDRDAGKGAFENLPWQAQTAIFSVLYQRGVNSPKRYQHVWDKLVRGDWFGAARDFGTAANWNGYMTRRRKEAMLLAELAGGANGGKR